MSPAADGTPTDVQWELAQKANVCRFLAAWIYDEQDMAAQGAATVLTELGNDLADLCHKLEPGGEIDE